jgi:hypothetical protein
MIYNIFFIFLFWVRIFKQIFLDMADGDTESSYDTLDLSTVQVFDYVFISVIFLPIILIEGIRN